MMSFDYTPMTEEECQKAKEFALLPDGQYDFEVTEAKPRYSSTGNAMIALKLSIWHEDKDFGVFDFLVATTKMGWKTKHFCEAIGLEKEYTAKQFHADMALNKRGRVLISTDPAKPKNDGSGGMYGAKNKVEDYIPANMVNNPFAPIAPAAAPIAPSTVPFNDDVPF